MGALGWFFHFPPRGRIFGKKEIAHLFPKKLKKLKFLKNTLGSHANDVGEDFIKNIIEKFDSRMEIVCANMSELARFLKLNSNVKDVYLPTFEKCEEAKLVKGTLERNASALSFRLLGDLERALALR